MTRILLLFSTLLSFSISGYSQNDCERLRVVSSQVRTGNHLEYIRYLEEADSVCDDIGRDNYYRLIACYEHLLEAPKTDSIQQQEYREKAIKIYEKLQARGEYDEKDDILLGYHCTQVPNYEKADYYLRRGIKTAGTELYDENIIILFYYNTYVLWYSAKDAQEKEKWRQQLQDDYIELSKLIAQADFNDSIQEGITGLFAQTALTCEELAILANRSLLQIPQDTLPRQRILVNQLDLLSSFACEEMDVYQRTRDSLFAIAPNEAVRFRNNRFRDLTDYSDRLRSYEELLNSTSDENERNEIKYHIAWTQAKLGSYRAAYNTAKEIGGEFKGKALQIMANAVIATANSCGVSTFERQCNYIYALQLYEEAVSEGASIREGTIAMIRARIPENPYTFPNNSITLDCWGVTVEFPE